MSRWEVYRSLTDPHRLSPTGPLGRHSQVRRDDLDYTLLPSVYRVTPRHVAFASLPPVPLSSHRPTGVITPRQTRHRTTSVPH